MTIRIKFFAITQDLAGATETSVELAENVTVAEVVRWLGEKFPRLGPYLPRVAYSINYEVVSTTHPLHNGDELAVLPAFSGGTDSDWIEITAMPLDVSAAVKFVTDPAAGGIDVFLGTTRADTNPSGQSLLALDYQAYDAMAVKQFHDMAIVVRKKWDVRRAVILHRVGRVEIGQPSVLIAVSTPHRAAAFEACRWLIDELKKVATIWKLEVWSDGGKTWVHPQSQ